MTCDLIIDDNDDLKESWRTAWLKEARRQIQGVMCALIPMFEISDPTVRFKLKRPKK